MPPVPEEVRSVAKAIGASLKQQGHAVPQSVLLNAVAAALNGRYSATLRDMVAGTAPATSAAHTPVAALAGVATSQLPPELRLLDPYRFSKYLLRMAYAAGKPVRPIPELDQEIGRTLVSTAGATVPAALDLSGELVPVEFNFVEQRLAGRLPKLSVRRPVQYEVSLELPRFRLKLMFYYLPEGGWQPLDAEEFVRLLLCLAEAVPEKALLEDPPEGAALARSGPKVPCKLQVAGPSDNLIFDARNYLVQASGPGLARLIQWQFLDGSATPRGMLKHERRTTVTKDIAELLDRVLARKVEYELLMSKAALLRWCRNYRPFILADCICAKHDIRTVARGQPLPVWDWETPGAERSAQPFETNREATIDAMLSLGFFDKLLAAAREEDRIRGLDEEGT